MLKIQQLFSFRLLVCFLCFTGVIFGGVMTFFFQDMFNAILAQVSRISPYTLKRESNRKLPTYLFFNLLSENDFD